MKAGPHLTRMLLLCALVLIAALPALAADPVAISVAVTGDTNPGATAFAKANVTINDGSTLQSITWSQSGGLAAALSNTTSETVTVVLPKRDAFKDHLIEVLEEAPIADAQFPVYVPRAEKFEGGLQNRFAIAGVSPHALTDAGAIKLDAKVVTTSGTYKATATIAAKLPWTTSTGVKNVPILLPVLLHGKTQATYNWSLTTRPPASAATLSGATTQNPEFTPDVAGTYVLTVNDVAANKPVTLTIHAGTWKGMLAGVNAEGRPVADTACTQCHVKNTPHFDLFTPWSKTGHAEIFTQNVNTPNGHYGPGCLGCHTVGYAPDVNNGGVDDAADFPGFLASNLMAHGDPLNWKEILTKFPQTAKLSNIQCENCHGPQDSAAHMKKDGSRMNYSSEVCGSCHGEPTRHGRFQQWQLSGHANYVLAGEEGTNSSCAKCHSAQGYVQWAYKGFSTAPLEVTWTTEEVHPQTCQTCHDPHTIGTSSGRTGSDSTVRVIGTTPMLDGGFVAKNVGKGAICMTCHNSRRGLRDDAHFNTADATRATHLGPQADIVMGQNLYFTEVGKPGFHGQVTDSCVACHMEKTDPPDALAYAKGGTNHTFYASPTICVNCHSNVTAQAVQGEVEEKLETLKADLELALRISIQTQIRFGNVVDVNGQKLRDATDVAGVELAENHGQQGIIVKLGNGTKLDVASINAVKVVPPAGASSLLSTIIDPTLAKAGWNFFMIESDASKGVHNPAFVNSALDVAIFAVKSFNATKSATPVSPGANYIGGGTGNGAGAVSCTTPYVYWADIAGHAPGNGGSQWRTDLIARNLSSSTASVKFILHQAAGNLEGNATIVGFSQGAFEDVVQILGGTNNTGALEICSTKPLLVSGRIFNDGGFAGTFGQDIDGHVADLGYGAGQTVSLIGLRQKTDAYRTNLTVTNAGKTDADVAIVLYDDDGKTLTTYNLTVPAGLVVMETEPFKNRANAPDLGWGYATVTVLKGSNIQALASLIDTKTNDPTTIRPKQ